jgi:predicted outer membrane repeat protein
MILGLLVAILAMLTSMATPLAQAAPKTTRNVSPFGTDSGNCSVSACKTITYALTQATAGDTLNLEAGTYSAANGETLPLVPTVDVTINGAGAIFTIIDGANTQRVMTVNSGRNITLQNLTITRGKNAGFLCVIIGSPGEGGGVCNLGTLTVSNSTFSGNDAEYGGGIYNATGTLTVSNSTFYFNLATHGAGIYNATGTLTVSNSTFWNNRAWVLGNGGGIDNNNGTLTVSNSTFSDNLAGYGGGIYTNGTLNMTNNTFSGNTADSQGGGIYKTNVAVNMFNTIIANSTGGDCYSSCTMFCISGSSANNLDQDSSCPATIHGDPKLGPLASNGGATQTFALLPNSPAIDAGSAVRCSSSPINSLDQRGQSRNDLQCDIGAYEMQMTDRNNTTLNPGTTMRTFGPPRAGIQYSGIDPGATTVIKVTSWSGGTPSNTLGAWWEITPVTGTGLNLTLSLCYSTAELGSLTESNLRFWRYSGGTWSQVGGAPTLSGASPNRCAQIAGVTDLSRWTLATGNPGSAPTAVTLSSFRANTPTFDLVAWFKQMLGLAR